MDKPFRLVLATPAHAILGKFDSEHEAREMAMRAHWRGPVEVQEREEVEGEGEVWRFVWRKE